MPNDGVAPPRYQRELKPTKLSVFHATLEQVLKVDALRTGKALLAYIKADGYPGSYSVTEFIRHWCGSCQSPARLRAIDLRTGRGVPV